jgi:sugar transferase (PEP-CTERM/EpsH1 system associated)
VSERRKLLFLSTRIPYPLDTGGKIRAYHVLSALATYFHVTLLAFCGKEVATGNIAAMKKLGVNVLTVFNPLIDSAPRITDVVHNFGSDLPLTVAKYYSPSMNEEIEKLMGEGVDVVHCEQLHMATYVTGRFPAALRGLDAHNVEAQLAERYVYIERNLVRKALLMWNRRKLQRFETNSVQAFDLVLAVSREDRETFSKLGAGDNVKVLQNGVNVDYFSPSDKEDDNSIVFVGSMDWKPNIDGVEYFIDSIFPLIRRANPVATFTVVGKSPPESVRRLGSEENGIRVTGTVDDVRPYLEKAAVSIVPLRFGGGTRLKVLEAFAAGKAVVSTSLGCEGIDCEDGNHIFIRDSAESFAAAVVLFLKDRILRRSMGARARGLAESEYDWRALGKKLRGYYEELLSGRQEKKGSYVQSNAGLKRVAQGGENL